MTTVGLSCLPNKNSHLQSLFRLLMPYKTRGFMNRLIDINATCRSLLVCDSVADRFFDSKMVEDSDTDAKVRALHCVPVFTNRHHRKTNRATKCFGQLLGQENDHFPPKIAEKLQMTKKKLNSKIIQLK